MSETGFKQGDVLSTPLFNLFINNPPKLLITPTNTDDVNKVPKPNINSLMFTYDLTKLFPLIKEGLQKIKIFPEK